MLQESHKIINETNAMLRNDYEQLKKEYEDESIIWQQQLNSLRQKLNHNIQQEAI